MWLAAVRVAPWLQQYPMVACPSGGLVVVVGEFLVGGVVAVCAALQEAQVTVGGGLGTWMPTL